MQEEVVNNNLFIVTLDDDPSVSRLLEKATGLRSVSFSSGRELCAVADKYNPLAAFVDIHLGVEENGLDVITTLRSKWPYCPVIVVTGDPKDEALEQAFKMGADDFVLKPIRAKEIQSRFQTRLTQLQERAGQVSLRVGDLTLDTAHRTVTGPLGRHFLAPVETLILAQLIKARGTVVPKEVLKREAWGLVQVSDNAFYRKLFELRRALKGVTNAVKIQSVYRSGLSLKTNSAFAVS